MIEIKGKYSEAKVYTNKIDENAAEQIKTLCNQEFAKGAQIRIMPDVHAGAGCVIGFTADLGEMVIPDIVGVDIGCGMLTVKLGDIPVEFDKLDRVIREYVPSGKNVHEGRFNRFAELQDLHCYRSLKKTKWIDRSMGTLGGGNHFIEIDIDDEGCKYLVIHTGSRNLGKQVAEIYQNTAYDLCRGAGDLFEQQETLIREYKEAGRRQEIQSAIKKLKAEYKLKETAIPKNLCYLTGKYREQYLHDMGLCQKYAQSNRKVIAAVILQKMFEKELDEYSWFETVHNYIDLENNIVRKGAVSAREGEQILIPINMRDGSLICIGKGNSEWNCSAPHGAGRVFSRRDAEKRIELKDFIKSMEGIYSTSVSEATIDESPMAYKTMDDIVSNIADTAEIVKVIKPVYNFKAD